MHACNYDDSIKSIQSCIKVASNEWLGKLEENLHVHHQNYLANGGAWEN